jgi:hypothetical protein
VGVVSLVNIGWVVVVALAGVIVVIATIWLRRHQDLDLGSVSHQWIAEQRLGQGHDAER